MYFNSGYRYTWLRLHLFVVLDALCITLAVRLPFTPRTEPKKNIFGVCVLAQKRIFRYGRCIVGLDFVINWPKKNQIVELMKWTIGNTLLVFFNRLFVYKKDYVIHKNFSSGMSAEPFFIFFHSPPHWLRAWLMLATEALWTHFFFALLFFYGCIRLYAVLLAHCCYQKHRIWNILQRF